MGEYAGEHASTERESVRPAEAAATASAPHGVSTIGLLQRTAGNAAVARLIGGRLGTAVLQRQGTAPSAASSGSELKNLLRARNNKLNWPDYKGTKPAK